MPFSVLLSVYYKENPLYLKHAIDSILEQTYPPDEIILVEDGPLNDQLYIVLDSYKNKANLKRIRLKENKGLGNALNEGLKYCSYNLVARMDTDDIAYSDRFEKQVKYMESHPEIDVCSAWIDEFIDNTTNVIATKKLPESDKEIKKYAKHRCPINHPVVIYRKNAVLAAGGYCGFPEDYRLWIKMIMKGNKFHNLQESLLYFRYSLDMMKRRGGWQYAQNDIKAQIDFFRIGYINIWTLFYNVLIRIIVRLLPNKIRNFIYKKTLRN